MSLTQVFKALSDPIRRQILRMLAQGDLSAGEIAAGFSISKPSVSHHLAVLKQAGLGGGTGAKASTLSTPWTPPSSPR